LKEEKHVFRRLGGMSWVTFNYKRHTHHHKKGGNEKRKASFPAQRFPTTTGGEEKSKGLIAGGPVGRRGVDLVMSGKRKKYARN